MDQCIAFMRQWQIGAADNDTGKWRRNNHFHFSERITNYRERVIRPNTLTQLYPGSHDAAGWGTDPARGCRRYRFDAPRLFLARRQHAQLAHHIGDTAQSGANADFVESQCLANLVQQRRDAPFSAA
jgi:hypothetical protein